ncbi:leucine-rich repeat domain-containing protein [Clostridium niameyense]|uniref:leucine-rich repeat domain-containing protein n=1 Tax=Clostridium niameyense TaxID=1622073 RepID=UPI00067F21E3
MNKKLESVKLPETIETIEYQAFAKNNLTSIKLPKSLKELGNLAFSDNKLKSVDIPKGISNIATGCFSKNEITSINIPKGVSTIGRAAFMGNRLESIIIPSTVDTIGAGAFSKNKLKSVTVPENVSDIGKSAFENGVEITYEKLTEAIKYGEKINKDGKSKEDLDKINNAISEAKNLSQNKNANFKDVNNKVNNIYESIISKDLEVSKGNITKYNGKEKDIVIPDSINGEKVISIDKKVFAKKDLSSLKLPKSLKQIGDAAFMGNNFKSITLPYGLESIGMGAFMGNKLEALILPDSVKSIDSRSFMNNELTSITLSKNMNEIPSFAFNNNKLNEMIIPSNIKIIRGGSFQKNNFKTIIIPSTVNEIEAKTFDDTTKVIRNTEKVSLKSIKPLGDLVVNIGTSGKNVIAKLPKQVTIVDSKNKEHNVDVVWRLRGYKENEEKEYEATAKIKLPEGLVQPTPAKDLKVSVKIIVKLIDSKWKISDFTFNGTTITGFSESGKEKFTLNKDLILPDTNKDGAKITEIGDKAFSTELRISGAKDTLKNKDSAKQDSKLALHSVKIPSTVKVIGKEAFRNNLLTKVDLPKGLTTIKTLAFNNNKLEKLAVPDSVTSLENGAFTYNNIDDLILSKNLKTIEVAFSFNNLQKLIIPEGIVKISDRAFSDNKIEKLTLPSTLEYLSGFNNNNFKSITIPKSVKELGLRAFERNKISSVVIPGNVKKIGKSAFGNTWHDTFLTFVTIEEGVEEIDKYAFSQDHLKDVQIPSTVKKIEDNAFSKNLGHDGVVYLFTPGYKNLNNIQDSKYHVVNPSTIRVQYKCEDTILKEENIAYKLVKVIKDKKEVQERKYFHIGDKGISINPYYENNEYEIIDKNERKVDLKHKENTLIIECKKKDVVDELTIKSIGEVAPVVVNVGENEDSVKNKLSKTTYITDSNDKKHEDVKLNWKLENFDGNTKGEYRAIGTFTLPQGVSQPDTPLELKVNGRIIVKQNLTVENNKWDISDFIFGKEVEIKDGDNTRKIVDERIIVGFSKLGEEKLKSNKNLILPKVNSKNEAITRIENYAFKNKGLETVVIPDGINGLVVGTNAFEGNKINKVYIGEGVKELDAYAFAGNKLEHVEFPGTLKKIGNHTFADNNLISAVFSPETEKIAIDRFSFRNNKITSITLLKDVTKVNGQAFEDNKSYNSDGKVHIFTKSFDPNDCNQWFPNSKYHKIIPLK